MNKDNNFTSKIDYTLIFIVFLLGCISVIAIYFAPITSSHLTAKQFVIRQIFWYVVSSLLAIGIMFLDYERFKWIAWFLYGILMVLLLGLFAQKHGVSVPFAAGDTSGAYSWYNLPALGSIQPSEFMKVDLILLISQIMVKHNEMLAVRTIQDDFKLIGKILGVSLPPFALVLLQPDLGTVTVFMAIIVSMFLISGIRWRIIFGMFAVGALGIASLTISYFINPKIISFFLESHQLDRFKGWLDPIHNQNNEGYQLIQSLMTIGSGQLYGQSPKVVKDISLPAGWTDFIFSTISGVFGFIGASVTIAIFFLLIYRIVNAALKTHDPYGTYICTGVIGMLTFTIFENIGMTIQLMPITGIPLPFLSYGGSSLLTNFFAIGLILSIEARSRQYMFD
ncbi:cell division protein FtsW [Pullulanibacillus camelliae]|uniref:Cell division protein FtsW n=1 Tax=Pullulanibacillus camelliae TaxID=1707096 RepID=A0A8J2YKK8_9BACL|nr:FtsW/RodA/SpoVE family cell cycle protein [Pullulanibacillus camelliae]GGE51341.1 cell division protein FtsW [Pullulanibacillus camelliae]